MPFAAKIAFALLAGGVGGYVISRLLARESSVSLASNRAVMSAFGAALGVVAVVAFPGSPAVAALTTAEEFNREVVRAGKPAVVDFYADWCRPCRWMKPIVNDLAQEYAGRIKFYKVDVDEAPGLAAVHGVRGIPVLLFYRNGQQVGRMEGSVPAAMLRQDLEALLHGL